MESYLQEAPCLYFSAKDDGSLVEVNETCCRMLGYQKEELVVKKLDAIFTIATRIFQQTHFFPLLKMQGHAEEIFITLLTKTGDHLPVLINAERKLVNNEAVSIYVGIIVHQRKKFEDELIAAKKIAENALNENTALLEAKQELHKHAEQLDQQISLINKHNEELRQFSHVVTHELQEPLRKLFIFTNMILENKNPQTAFRTIEKVKNVSEQMRSILSGLQQYVWLTETSIKLTKINLNKLLLVVKEQLVKEHPETNICIEAEELPMAEADWEQMQFLLHQILSNAVRFRKLGEEVRVQISGNSLLLNQFRNISEKYKYTEFLRLQIKDYGIGFDATYKDQAFELFRRLHTESGRGIGLSLCKKIVENHHGTISIDSIKGKETTVNILLPLQPTKSLENLNEKQLKAIPE